MLPERLAEKRLDGLTGWGRYPSATTSAVRPEKVKDFRPTGDHCLARGLGRSYGDAALLTGGTLVLTTRFNRFLAFDPTAGLVRAEAGVSLKEVIEACLPHGWFLPVTPGTKNCTLGGCFAADVHGKNHHREGTFSAHVRELELVTASGESRRLQPDDPLFWATAGGMGLTGLIREVTLQLTQVETAYMKVRHAKTADLEQTVELLCEPTYDARYTVAWVDCLAGGRSLGRGIFMAGEHAGKSEISLRVEEPLAVKGKRKKSLPFDFPTWALNPLTVKSFNALYYRWQGSRGEFVCGLDPFFYPLDGIEGWNRMYGRKGFVQYQYVMPMATAPTGTRRVLERLSAARRASFLAVLKRFGPEGRGLLSFPREGLTLALDIPWSDDLPDLLAELDKTVLDAGGRLYLAKDARMPPAAFHAGYPRLEEFCEIKRQVDPDGRFDSDMARRLLVCR